MEKPNLSVVIVNYNSSNNLRKCLTELLNQPKKLPLECYVVDNNSKDASLSMVKTLFPQVHLICNKKNVGFAVACNQAIKQAKGDFILLLNPDVFVQQNTLTSLLTYIQKQPTIGIVTCKLLNTDGSTQYSRRRFPVPPVHFLKALSIPSKLVSNYLMHDVADNVVQDIDWAIGAFLLIRKEVLTTIGLLDERFFIYFEEADLCYRTKQAGWRIVYYPSVTATHVFQQSSHKLFSKPFFHHLRSMYLYYKKHGIKPNIPKISKGGNVL